MRSAHVKSHAGSVVDVGAVPLDAPADGIRAGGADVADAQGAGNILLAEDRQSVVVILVVPESDEIAERVGDTGGFLQIEGDVVAPVYR